MVFSALSFLFAFLPLVFGLYYLSRNRVWRNGVLLVFSLLFYSWGEPKLIVLMLAASTIAYLGGWGICLLGWLSAVGARSTQPSAPKSCAAASALPIW